MKKIFFFKDLSAQHVKVSHGAFVGLPSITGLTGLARNFSIQLATSLNLDPSEIQPAGAMLAIDDYHLHEGYKKRHKPKNTTYESIPSAWASFTAHIGIEVESRTDAAIELLSGAALNAIAVDILTGMSFCKGSLQNVRAPVDLNHPRLKRFGTDRQKVLGLIPSQSLVVRDCGFVVTDMRMAGLPLMEGLIASTVGHSKRPLKYRNFFEHSDLLAQDWRFAPVMSGYLKLETVPSGKSVRPDIYGVLGSSTVASPAFTLSRLQKASSIRAEIYDVDDPCASMRTFWKEVATPKGYFNHAV